MLYIQRNGGLCLLLGTTGIPCPGCGLTRATLSALRGDIATAFAYHPLFFAPYVMIGMWLVSSRFSGMKKAAFITVIVLAAAMIVCWIIRLIGGWNGYLTP
ncbi:MAG: DUF2752 domain-containing protein [Clostridia bacterium]|nr:DUF2752 domain-containing protein [Clostridia bacterium]